MRESNQIREQIKTEVIDILRIEESCEVTYDADLFEMGFDSLNLALLCSRLTDLFRIEIPILMMFEFSTIDGIARFVEDKKGE